MAENKKIKKSLFWFLLALIFAAVFYVRSQSTSPFSVGEQVHTKKSGNYLALQDGGQEFIPVEAWWRFTVLGSGSDGWVHIVDHTTHFKRYVKSSMLEKGWITADEYLAPQIQQQETKMLAEAKKVHLPSTAQLKAEAIAAKKHVTPAAKMEGLIAKVNRLFGFYDQPMLLQNCHRSDHFNFECQIAPQWGGGTGYVGGDLDVTLYLRKTNMDETFLERLATPLVATFTPTAPQHVISEKVNGFLRRWVSGQRHSIGLYPFYGSISYKLYPNKTRIIIDGSPERPFINGQYVRSYRSSMP